MFNCVYPWFTRYFIIGQVRNFYYFVLRVSSIYQYLAIRFSRALTILLCHRDLKLTEGMLTLDFSIFKPIFQGFQVPADSIISFIKL